MIDPKQKAVEIFNSIRFIDGENPNCTTCDCVVKTIAIFHVKGIIEASPSLPILGDGGTFGEDIELSKNFWQEVLNELNKM